MSSGMYQGILIAPEASLGVLAAGATYQRLRFTSASVDGDVTGTESAEIREGMISAGEYKTAVSFTGEISGELSALTYDDLISAAFHNDWTENSIVLGTLRKTFSIIREYRDAGGYHTFRGMTVTSVTFTLPEEGMVEVSFSLQGTGREPVTFTAPTGIKAPTTTKPITNVGIGDLAIDGQSMADVACCTAFSMTIEFSTEAQKCFGKGLSVGKIIETGVAITGALTLAWGDEAAAFNELKFTDTSISIEVSIADEAGNGYTFLVPEATVKAPLPSGGRTDLLQYELEYTVRNQSPKITRTVTA